MRSQYVVVRREVLERVRDLLRGPLNRLECDGTPADLKLAEWHRAYSDALDVALSAPDVPIERMRQLQQEWRTHATSLQQLRAAEELGRLLGVEDEMLRLIAEEVTP